MNGIAFRGYFNRLANKVGGQVASLSFSTTLLSTLSISIHSRACVMAVEMTQLREDCILYSFRLRCVTFGPDFQSLDVKRHSNCNDVIVDEANRVCKDRSR